MTEATEQAAFSEWCILELMGHRRLAGLVTECQVAGHGFLRLDVPHCDSGLGAGWCTVHGKCGCDPVESGNLSSETCPLHGARSDHPKLWTATQFYSPSSVYCMTPVSEDVARKIAVTNTPAPATRWELERASAVPVRGRHDEDDDDYDGPGF